MTINWILTNVMMIASGFFAVYSYMKLYFAAQSYPKTKSQKRFWSYVMVNVLIFFTAPLMVYMANVLAHEPLNQYLSLIPLLVSSLPVIIIMNGEHKLCGGDKALIVVGLMHMFYILVLVVNLSSYLNPA